MDSFVQLIKTLSDLGFSPLNVVLIIMLYFMGAHSGIFPKFWGEQGKKNLSIKDLHDEMFNLKSYFNHETTERLDGIKESQKNLYESQEKIKSSVEELNRRHDVYDNFGIKIRKEN